MATVAARGKRGVFFGRSGWQLLNESEGVYGDAERRVREACLDGKLSNRRYRRWVNDRLLRELAPPMDSVEIGGLFAPPPWGEKNYKTPFEQVAEVGAPLADAWEPFRNNVDMDYQAKVLKQFETAGYRFQRDDDAMFAWRTVDHRARVALKRNSDSPHLQILEDKLLEFLSEGNDELVLEISAPLHRLLLHGLSQFHGLVSQSEPASPATRVHITRRSKCKDQPGRSHLNLYKFLQDVRQAAAVVS